MSKIRILQKGTSALSKNTEVILVASSMIGTAALIYLLPERLHWGMSEAGNVAPDTPDGKPNKTEGLLDILLLDNPDIEPFCQITAQECGITRDMPFGEAFNHARSMLGAGAVFAWHGKLYNTFFREEWSAMSPEDRQGFMNSIDFSYVPEDEIPPLPEPEPTPIIDPDDPIIDPDDPIIDPDDPIIDPDDPIIDPDDPIIDPDDPIIDPDDPIIDPDEPVIGGDTLGSDDDLIILTPNDDFPNHDITDIPITPDDVYNLDDNIDFNNDSDIDGMA